MGGTRVEALIQADLADIALDFAEVLRPLTADDLTALINRYDRRRTEAAAVICSSCLVIRPVQLAGEAWSWVQAFAKQEDDDLLNACVHGY